MAEKFYTYKLSDPKKNDAAGYPISETGGPATEEKIEELIQRHYPAPYFEQQEDGRILIFRRKAEATDVVHSVGEVFEVK